MKIRVESWPWFITALALIALLFTPLAPIALLALFLWMALTMKITFTDGTQWAPLKGKREVRSGPIKIGSEEEKL